MNKPIRRVAIACLLLFVILLVNDNVVQYANAKTLRDKPGNTRLLFQQYDRKRGDIVTATGVTIASSVPTNDTLKYLRRYSNGPLFAPVTGFYSIIYGGSQIESADNSILAGTDDRLFGVQQLSNLITGRTPEGGNVVLTIDPVLQQVAYTALAGRKGAVVAVDPSTGAILAMVTSPSYDPNVLSSHNQASITQDWEKLIADTVQPDARPCAPTDLSAGIDFQADHRGSSLVDRSVHAQHGDSGSCITAAAAVDQRLAQLPRGKLWRAGDADPGVDDFVQHRVRRVGPDDRAGRAAGAGRCLRVRLHVLGADEVGAECLSHRPL